MPTPEDEGRHPPGDEPLWNESWYFDFALADGSLGGFVRLAVDGDRATFWAALVGDDRPYLLVRDDDVAPPAGSTPEIRAEALWSALECETPLEHWTVGLEAFAVALDDPEEAWHGERGDRVGLGFDLEWEGSAPAVPGERAFGQTCTVHGEVLVGRGEQLAIDGHGWRCRSWAQLTLPEPPGTGAVRHRAPLLDDGAPVVYELRQTGFARGVP